MPGALIFRIFMVLPIVDTSQTYSQILAVCLHRLFYLQSNLETEISHNSRVIEIIDIFERDWKVGYVEVLNAYTLHVFLQLLCLI